ncbi:MAG TPA: hypothetical protein VHW23_13720, partial [Kofleriaceae bacterium]|nr:hypothetical protein [Kofleriaceae bacterium]
MRAVLTVAAAVIAAARPAAADPMEPRVLTAPTAWLLPSGAAAATLGVDHRGDPAAFATAALGGLADVELDEDADVRGCTDCAMQRTPLHLARATFRI